MYIALYYFSSSGYRNGKYDIPEESAISATWQLSKSTLPL